MDNKMPDDIANFLLKNGFQKISYCKYGNGKCQVHYHVQFGDESIEVYDTENDTSWYQYDTIIYTLIGYLTYYNLMDRNYADLQHTQAGGGF